MIDGLVDDQRATFPVPQDSAELQEIYARMEHLGITLLRTIDRPLEGESWALVRDQNLPGWRRGARPMHFDSLEMLIEYMTQESPMGW